MQFVVCIDCLRCLTGPNGKTAIVTTGWILVPGSEIPKMTTVLVKLGANNEFK